MGKLFINKSKQLRSGWKIAITLVSALLVTMILQVGLTAIFMIIEISKGQTLIQSINSLNVASLTELGTYFQSISFILSVLLFWKIFDRKPLKEMGMPKLKYHWKDLCFGLFLGIFSISAVFAILLLLDMIKVDQNFESATLVGSILKGLVLFIIVGFSEEMFSRGYNMTVLKQTGNKWVMVLVSSILFSLLHGANPNVSFIGFLNIFLIAILFAYMFIKTNNIWLSIGYHITWNFFQGNIFGFQVSGIELEGLYKVKLTSDNIWNGGSFGAEGGLITTLMILVGVIATHFYVKAHQLRG